MLAQKTTSQDFAEKKLLIQKSRAIFIPTQEMSRNITAAVVKETVFGCFYPTVYEFAIYIHQNVSHTLVLWATTIRMMIEK